MSRKVIAHATVDLSDRHVCHGYAQKAYINFLEHPDGIAVLLCCRLHGVHYHIEAYTHATMNEAHALIGRYDLVAACMAVTFLLKPPSERAGYAAASVR